jgi:hypothetical protein
MTFFSSSNAFFFLKSSFSLTSWLLAALYAHHDGGYFNDKRCAAKFNVNEPSSMMLD